MTQAFTLFSTKTPQIWAEIDRTKAEQLGVPIARVFETLSVYMGSGYVNDFNILGRTYRVTAQADDPYRLTVRDVGNLKTRSASGEMVPIGSVATFSDTTGPYRVRATTSIPRRDAGRPEARLLVGKGITAIEGLAERPPSGSASKDRDRAAGEARRDTPCGGRPWRWCSCPAAGSLTRAGCCRSRHPDRAECVWRPCGRRAARARPQHLFEIGLVVLVGLAAKNAI